MYGHGQIYNGEQLRACRQVRIKAHEASDRRRPTICDCALIMLVLARVGDHAKKHEKVDGAVQAEVDRPEGGLQHESERVDVEKVKNLRRQGAVLGAMGPASSGGAALRITHPMRTLPPAPLRAEALLLEMSESAARARVAPAGPSLP